MKDETSKIIFLFDTGAEVSIVLPTKIERKRPPNRNLVAANNTPISTYETHQMTLQFHDKKFKWRFHVADAHSHIIGADFLRAHGLVPDLNHRRLP